MEKLVGIVGERGLVSRMIQDRLSMDPDVIFQVYSTEAISNASDQEFRDINRSDLIILCTQDFKSENVMAVLEKSTSKIIDTSPTYRCDRSWIYGLPEVHGEHNIAFASRVANPGCFASAAILLIAPMRAHSVLWGNDTLYLDAVGGYTTGGAKMIAQFHNGTLAPECEYGFVTEHRHIAEIKRHADLKGNICFTPKIGSFDRGIRMQTIIPNSDRINLLRMYTNAYKDTDIQVDLGQPSKLTANEWAYKSGAIIRVYQQGPDCLVVCSMDNMGFGSVDTIINNMKLMLGMK